jgi:hypothetical protein
MTTITNILDYLKPIVDKRQHIIDIHSLSLNERLEKFEYLYNINLSYIDLRLLHNKRTLVEIKKLILEEDIKILSNVKERPNVYMLSSPVLVSEIKKETTLLKSLKKWIEKETSFSVLVESEGILKAIDKINEERTLLFKRNVILMDSLRPSERYSYNKFSNLADKTEYLTGISTYIKRKIETI